MTTEQRNESWDELLQQGTGPTQEAFLELVRRTHDCRHYCDNLMWGMLQTPDYARAVLRLVVDVHQIPDDVEAGVAARTARAQYLGRGGREYHVLLGEQALRTNMGGADVMRAQLRRVLEAMDTPGLTLGVIPARAPMAAYPSNSFSIFDGARVEIEPYSSAESITEPSDVALYERVFSLLQQSAVYGRGARELVEAELTALG
ncbi:DUF5753 domain-containing protein [Streptomyces sp. NPDC020412]|uniref:DUF5753 domain-containing protein n=1 Tax=Streptomyces sp. NPDC020412 TaxID=3365073 RepID=UPI0037A83D6E